MNHEILTEAIANEKTENYLFLDAFQNTFEKLNRPIVCYYSEGNNFLHILCFDLITSTSYNKQNNRFLETRSISQKSPLEIMVYISAGFLAYAYNIIEGWISIYKLSIKKEESSSIPKEDKLNYYKEEIEKLSLLKTTYFDEEIRAIEKTKESKKIDKISSVESYSYKIIKNIERNNKHTFSDYLKDYDLNIEELKNINKINREDAE